MMPFGGASSALDPWLVGAVPLAIRRLSGEGVPMLVVTDELGFAGRVVFLKGGRLHEEGTPRRVPLDLHRTRVHEFPRGRTPLRLPGPAAAGRT